MADFSTVKFRGETWFTGADFTEYATFSFAVFFDKTYFKDFIQEGKTIGVFNGKTSFNYVYFEARERIVFDVEDLSKASFMDTDITRVSFSDRVRWGKEDKFKVIEEEVLEKDLAGRVSSGRLFTET